MFLAEVGTPSLTSFLPCDVSAGWVFLTFRLVIPRRELHGVYGTEKRRRNIIKMDEMREGRRQSDRDIKGNNRKMCNVYTDIHTHIHQTELEEYNFRLAENFVFLKESEGFVEQAEEGGYDELILPHHWAHRNVNLLVHRLEWII
jgi:hypothetical protein